MDLFFLPKSRAKDRLCFALGLNKIRAFHGYESTFDGLVVARSYRSVWFGSVRFGSVRFELSSIGQRKYRLVGRQVG